TTVSTSIRRCRQGTPRCPLCGPGADQDRERPRGRPETLSGHGAGFGLVPFVVAQRPSMSGFDPQANIRLTSGRDVRITTVRTRPRPTAPGVLPAQSVAADAFLYFALHVSPSPVDSSVRPMPRAASPGLALVRARRALRMRRHDWSTSRGRRAEPGRLHPMAKVPPRSRPLSCRRLRVRAISDLSGFVLLPDRKILYE